MTGTGQEKTGMGKFWQIVCKKDNGHDGGYLASRHTKTNVQSRPVREAEITGT
jgi:hypothetical protein